MPPAPGSPAPGPPAPDRRRTQSTPAPAGALGVLVGGAALLVTLAALVAWLSPATLGERPATCLSTSGARCFCEAVGTGLLRQPANSLSSLGFCVAAVTTAARGRRLGRHTPERVLAPVVALTLIALGAGGAGCSRSSCSPGSSSNGGWPPALAPSPSRCSPSASRMPRGWLTIGVCGVSRAPGCRATPSGICSPRWLVGCSSPTTAEPRQDTKTPPAPMPGAKRNCRELWVRPDVP